MWPLVRQAASKLPSPIWTVEILGFFGPFIIMLLLTTWISLIVCAYGLIAFSLANQYSPPLDSFLSALYLAGSYVMTLGSSDFVSKTTTARFLTIAAAFTGMIVTAVVISLLFTLLSSIQRREILVTIASELAGSPPTGIGILQTHANLQGRQSLSNYYLAWHFWCADVRGTHIAYPMLLYFRSTDPYTSWLTALGAALDSATLLLSTDFDGDMFSAQLLYNSSVILLRELAAEWRFSDLPAEEASYEEFHQLFLRLQQAGYCDAAEEQKVKDTFLRLHGQYIGTLRLLCAYFAVPYTELLSAHKFPQIERQLDIDSSM